MCFHLFDDRAVYYLCSLAPSILRLNEPDIPYSLIFIRLNNIKILSLISSAAGKLWKAVCTPVTYQPVGPRVAMGCPALHSATG